MSRDDDKKVRLVVSNTDIVRPPTDDLNQTFRTMAAHILEFIRSNKEGLETNSIANFLLALKSHEDKFPDEDRTSIGQLFDFSTQGEDDAINTILRGSLAMVAALIVEPDANSQQYKDAHEELLDGITKLNRAARMRRRK